MYANKTTKMNKEDAININWKEIAFELANIIDDFNILYQMQKEGEHMENNSLHPLSPNDNYLIKRFIQFNKHFVRYKNVIMHVSEYEIQRKKERDMLTQIFKQTNRNE